MKIFCIDGKDVSGVGGALRGREMSLALETLGQDCVLHDPGVFPLDMIRETPGLDAVINTGTWHQLAGRSDYFVEMARVAESLGIVPIWWYGSNGSVFGCTDADPAVRSASERRIIDLICERKFIAVICPYSMDIYERHGVPREKMRLVPSVFDGNLFCGEATDVDRAISARLRRDFRIPAGAFCIGTVGNTPNSKGGDEVIRAVALVKNEMPDLHYIILHSPAQNLNKARCKSPDGLREGKSEWDVLQDSIALAKSLGVADRCRFIGMRFPRTAMPTFYRLLHVYCSPSKAENLGQPLVESQLCGLPLVTYKGFSFDFVACPDTAQQIRPHHTETDDYGLVIPFAEPSSVADAIRRARSIAEADEDTGGVTRRWAYEKFHHHNARAMVQAISEYKVLM